LHLLVINFLNHTLLVVWTREENRILETEWTLFSDETFESFITEVAVLLFSVLSKFFYWGLGVVSFVSAVTLWSLFGLRRITRNLKTIEVTFFTWDVKITKDITLNWLKRLTSLTILGKIVVGINFLLFNWFFICFLRLCLVCILNVFQIFKELLILNAIQNVILVLNHIGIVQLRNFQRSNNVTQWNTNYLVLFHQERTKWRFEIRLLVLNSNHIVLDFLIWKCWLATCWSAWLVA